MDIGYLMDIGLTEEQAKKVMSALDGNFVTKSRFNTQNETIKSLKEQLNIRDQQLKELKKNEQASEELKESIKSLQSLNEKTKKDYEAKIVEMTLNNGIEMEVLKSGALLPKAVLSYLDRSKLILSEDGSISGLSEQLESLKTGATSILFKSNSPRKTDGYVPESSTPNKETNTKKQEEMTYDELCQVYSKE